MTPRQEKRQKQSSPSWRLAIRHAQWGGRPAGRAGGCGDGAVRPPQRSNVRRRARRLLVDRRREVRDGSNVSGGRVSARWTRTACASARPAAARVSRGGRKSWGRPPPRTITTAAAAAAATAVAATAEMGGRALPPWRGPPAAEFTYRCLYPLLHDTVLAPRRCSTPSRKYTPVQKSHQQRSAPTPRPASGGVSSTRCVLFLHHTC